METKTDNKLSKLTKICLPVLCSLILLLVAEFLFYFGFITREYLQMRKFITDTEYTYKNYLFERIKSYPLILHSEGIDERAFRPVLNAKSKEKPIMIFGCSYASGFNFGDEETISYVLSKYSKRPIYNRAQCGWSIQHMLYQIQNFDFSKIMKKAGGEYKAPKYVFYVLMDRHSHFYRMKQHIFPTLNNEYYISYHEKNGKLVQNKLLFNYTIKPLSFNYIECELSSRKVTNDFESKNPDLFNLFILHVKTINDLIKEKWGNDTKFVILTFEYTQKDMWEKQVKNMGVDVVDIAETVNKTDLQSDKYKLFYPPECPHPNVNMWNELVPKLKEIYPDL